MTMDASAIKALDELSKRGTPTVFHTDREPGDVFYRSVAHRVNGEIMIATERCVAEPKPRRYSASGVDDFVELVKRVDGTPRHPSPTVDAVPTPAVVFIDTDADIVVGVADESGARRERVSMELHSAPAATFLMVDEGTVTTENGVAEWTGSQQQIIDLLVHTFGLARTSLEVNAVSDVEFKRGATGTLTTNETQRSVSRSTLAEAKGVKETMPAEITFDTWVYDELSDLVSEASAGGMSRVVLSLSVDAEKEEFSLRWPETLHRRLCRTAALALQSVLRAKLAGNTVVIGSPNLG